MKKTNYLLTMVKKENGTNVGCVAITMDGDTLLKEKMIIDLFPGKDIKAEVFAKWPWAEKINEADKQWVSSKTVLDDIQGRIKDKLINRVSNYHPLNFLNYKMIDLLNEFNENNGRDASSFELNLIISKQLQRVSKHFTENPSEKRDVPIIEHLRTQYEHTGDKISIDSVMKSINLIG